MSDKIANLLFALVFGMIMCLVFWIDGGEVGFLYVAFWLAGVALGAVIAERTK